MFIDKRKYPILKESRYLFEKKDHLIKKTPNLTNEQKEEIINHFKEFPHKENLIDWNKLKDLTYNDFEKVIKQESKRQKKQNVKEIGLQGLKENIDYVVVYEQYPILAVMPLNWEASKLLASKYVCGVEGKWCTDYQKDSSYFIRYQLESHRHSIVYVLDFQKKDKMAIEFQKGEEIFWDKEDNKLPFSFFQLFLEPYGLKPWSVLSKIEEGVEKAKKDENLFNSPDLIPEEDIMKLFMEEFDRFIRGKYRSYNFSEEEKEKAKDIVLSFVRGMTEEEYYEVSEKLQEALDEYFYEIVSNDPDFDDDDYTW